MPNSDTAYGLFNKISKEIKQWKTHSEDPDSVVEQNFADVDAAKSFFLTDDAVALFEDNATQLSWAKTDDNHGLKFTIAFGTPTDSSQTHWGELWRTGKTALADANNFFKPDLDTYTDWGSAGASASSPQGGDESGADGKPYKVKTEDTASHLF